MASRITRRQLAIVAAVFVGVPFVAGIIWTAKENAESGPPYTLAATKTCLDDRGLDVTIVDEYNTATDAAGGELLVSDDAHHEFRLVFADDHDDAKRIGKELDSHVAVSSLDSIEQESLVRVDRNAVALAFSASEEDNAAASAALDRAEACLA